MSLPEGDLLSRIKIASINDVEYGNRLNKLLTEEVNLNVTEFKIDHKGLIWFKRRIYMPNVADLKLFILNQNAQTSLCRAPWLPKDDNNPQKAILLA